LGLEQLLKSAKQNRIGIGMAEKIQFVNTDEIIYCQANGAYTFLYMNDGSKIVATKTLSHFQEQLENSFFRVHNSFLINLAFVKEYQRNDGGYVLMSNNAKLEVSKRKRKEFLEAMDHLIV
jgi:two-component system, LytTR family, response regulator